MYKKETLPNGIRIVTEEIPYVRSAALGIWVKVGSRDETEDEHGLTHFIEHLFFKGTKNRTAKEIAEALDSVGGQLNAFTTKEYTCYYARVLDEHIDLGMDILSDMFFNSEFKEPDIEKEKKVVLEEIGMYEDSPEELVHDFFSAHMWPNHTLGRPILGTTESVKSITREKVLDYYNKHYTAPDIVIAVAGKIKHEYIVEKLSKLFEKVESQTEQNTSIIPQHGLGVKCHQKQTEQLQICIGVPGLPQEDDKIYTLHLINNILGGGLSSRLFQEIREERGLAYSVYSYHSAFRDCGLFTVYAGTNPANMKEVTEVVNKELNRMKTETVSDTELSKTKEQIKGNIYLGLENVSSRMSRIGKSELCFNRIITPEEVIQKVNAVSQENIKELAMDLFDNKKLGVTTIGPTCDPKEIDEITKSL